MPTNVNLKLLQTFLLVAKHTSFRKAAEASNRSAAAVSMQIKQLEAQTGLTLLRRTTRHVELTLEGQHLLDRTRKAFTDLDLSLLELKEAARLRQGLVTLAASPTVACTLLPGVLAKFCAEYPQVTVRLQELGLQDILRAVGEQMADFGVGPMVTNAADYQFVPLLRDPLCALVPCTHPLARRNRMELADLGTDPCVMLSSFAAVRKSVEDTARTTGVRLNVQYEVQQMQTLIAMASAGLGIGIAPRIAVGPAQKLPLRIVELSDDALVRSISIIIWRGRTLSPLATQLMALLRAAV